MAVICPQCRGEYRDEIVRCPDCEVDLVPAWALEDRESAPGYFQPDDDEPAVTVFEARDMGTLMVARSLLDEAEIRYAIHNDRLIDLMPSTATRADFGMIRGAEIQVLASRVDEARELLAALIEEESDR